MGAYRPRRNIVLPRQPVLAPRLTAGARRIGTTAVADVLAISLVGCATRLMTGTPALTTDGAQALYWGRELAHLHLPSYLPNAGITPHPLWILYGALCSLVAGATSAPAAMSLLPYASAGAIVWGGFRLARAIRSPAAGVIAAVILATSATLGMFVGLNYVDIPFAALVLWALVLECENPCRGSFILALLCLAGLLRPEAWLLSVAYWLYLWRSGSLDGRRWRLAGLAVLAPALWIGSDLLTTGDALFSLHAVQSFALSDQPAPTPLGLPGATVAALAGLVGTVVAVGGLFGAWRALMMRDRGVLPVVCVIAIAVVQFAFMGTIGLQLYTRFLTYAAVPLVVLVAYGIAPTASLRSRRSLLTWQAIGALVVSLWLLWSLPSRLAAVSRDTAVVRYWTTADSQVTTLAARPATATMLRGCRHVTAISATIMPYIAWAANVPGATLSPSLAVPLSDSVAFVTVVDPAEAVRWISPRMIARQPWRPPAGARLRAITDGYAVYTRGC